MAKAEPARMTLDEIRQRCRIDGDCWIWPGVMESGRYPRISVRTPDRQSLQVYIRVEVMRARGPMRDRHRWRIVSTCGEVRCVNHLRWRRNLSNQGVADRLKCAAAKAGKGGRLSLEVARRVRVEAPVGKAAQTEYARSLGVSYEAIRAILRGQSWREPIFGGLA